MKSFVFNEQTYNDFKELGLAFSENYALALEAIKTKEVVAILKNLNVEKALIVTADKDDNVVISARNIPTVRTAFTNTINVYDMLKYDTVVVTKDAVAKIEEVYA